uniref:Uncharacterized protein n=1 Tax=Cacopsylla melanoneura TaxID=428564 RepID=A0A8D9ACM4_9HEMI
MAMEKYAEFNNLKSLTNSHLSTFYNFPPGLQQLSDTDISVEQIPKYLDQVKCSLCNRSVDMYIDVDKEVFKRFYCSSCIASKKIPQFSSKPEYNGCSNGSLKSDSNNGHGSNTKSQSCQSAFSSPSFSTPVNLQTSKKSRAKQTHKQCPNYSSMMVQPCSSDCCNHGSVNGCQRYNHFLDVGPSCHSLHHSCEKEKGVNKRSWSVANRRPWTNEQKETIFSYFNQQIENRATIGKDDIIPLMELKKDLFADRSWKEIKWVYYHHLKVVENRKVKILNESSSNSSGSGLNARLQAMEDGPMIAMEMGRPNVT